MRPSKYEFTQLLRAAGAGDEDAKKRLWALMYEELRRIARRQLLAERADHTLSTTDLVHEAYLRLVDQEGILVKDRTHFRMLAARAMREILIDYARKRKAQKRGGGRPTLLFDEAIHQANEQAEDLLILDEPTASLDAETELHVMQNLAEWGAGRAIFLVTHRLSTIRRADQIVYLRDGRVVEAGSHGELMLLPEGAYRRFVELERSGLQTAERTGPADTVPT